MVLIVCTAIKQQQNISTLAEFWFLLLRSRADTYIAHKVGGFMHYVFVNGKIEFKGSYYSCLGYSTCLLVPHEILRVVG